jgi:hypothetical protein
MTQITRGSLEVGEDLLIVIYESSPEFGQMVDQSLAMRFQMFLDSIGIYVDY